MATGAAASPVVQTVVLRVSIHCHGCKKKVRRVLKSIEGVQNVTVDAAQHKVPVTAARMMLRKRRTRSRRRRTW
ncbi:hypothetical protein PVAP13_2NG517400 [Panicum virgatum]|uniref:HMA domain-containing protein n=1 Tax=Panicum virgatum TaxID=38727 RepID=A0A8T0VUV1_PANVG|nr:hypothetical protein PVAP13_2NG517400 [Panicum virgatum]